MIRVFLILFLVFHSVFGVTGQNFVKNDQSGLAGNSGTQTNYCYKTFGNITVGYNIVFNFRGCTYLII